jgi:hypothetical protein
VLIWKRSPSYRRAYKRAICNLVCLIPRKELGPGHTVKLHRLRFTVGIGYTIKLVPLRIK